MYSFSIRIPLKRIISPVLYLISAIFVASCQTTPPAESTSTFPSSGTLSPVPELPVANSVHYKVDPQRTDMRILVYRGGPLAKFGHNHVIRIREASGDIYIASDFHLSVLVLCFPVAALEVDPPAARADEGDDFASRPSTEAVTGTRKNMLGPAVLDGDNYPEIEIRSIAVIGPEWGPEITVQITLHGVTREYTVPIALEHTGQHLTATGTMVLRTTDFDMVPFSVLGGGLQVQDEVKVRFRIVADRV